jgi:hypothetical protein
VQVALEQDCLDSRSLKGPYSAVNLLTAGAFIGGVSVLQVDAPLADLQTAFATSVVNTAASRARTLQAVGRGHLVRLAERRY